MWVPIFFKGEFWAAMRSTQRSESMHAFYGGILHSKTSLVQFVHKYDNVLGAKEQRELEDDAVDSKGVIPCATSSPIEKQSQQEYTTSMFRDVQVEFVKKADCRASVVTEDWPVVRMKVEEKKLVDDTMICVSYVVHFDRSTQEVRCECNLFESSSVLCCHYLKVFHSFKVYKVPTCYVFPRWSKNIKRKHTYIKSSHDVSRSDVSHNAFKGLCAHFYNIAQEFVNDDDETALLHAALEEKRAKLSEHRAKKRSRAWRRPTPALVHKIQMFSVLSTSNAHCWSLQRAGQRVRGSDQPLRSPSRNLVGGKTRTLPQYNTCVNMT
ncbi:protein FAR1-RELATED SEQUENCE 5-like [Arachis duranensis]|uniref:Protein FAR1-RELATED SEQUENCE n=1 Tax=Arachis duranensis TaxID=130453 RepID=A0A6P4CN06_ARADU|nr:protein FAR1-RELATED SEQUENCE 5-like [Arachis duranensis]